jgi:hypothetical protein
MIDLTRFCNKDSYAKTCRHPFSHEGYTYATDGTLIIRVPKVKGYKEVMRLPWNQGPHFVFERKKRISTNLRLPEEYTYYCTGRIESKGVTQNFGFLLNQRIIYKLKDLPNLKIYLPHTPYVDVNQMFFEFTGGCGLAMGMMR